MNCVTAIFGLVWGLAMVGCSGRHDTQAGQSANDEALTVSVTQWTDKMELFMEHPVLATSTPAKFVIHLTVLDDFKPIREGAVTLTFGHESGQTFQVKRDYLLRAGIFNPVVELPVAGEYAFTVDYSGPRVKDSFEIDDFIVYESVHDIPQGTESGDEGITFLKEQQWKIDFRTMVASIKPIRNSIRAVGEVLPRQSSYAEITSPVAGVLRVEDNQAMVVPGSVVKVGQVLATISPPLGAVSSWTDRKLAYEYTKSEYERAQRLNEKNAISSREFEEIKNNYLIQKAGYEVYAQSGNSDLFQLLAPIAGTVAEIAVLPGQKVPPGQHLMTIVDPSVVWLRVNVFEKDYYRMSTPEGASLVVPGLEPAIMIEGADFRLLSMGNVLDSDSRTIPVLLEIANSDLLLKIGQTVQVDLNSDEETASLSVPENAILDEDRQEVVFVHKQGESFEKRIVETGNQYKGWVAVLSGVREGERVVTKGGYQVKLASTSAAIEHPHAH